MPLFHALVLGLVQGLTEFFPISSSAHLILVPWAFGWNDFAGDEMLKKAFDVSLHIGTLIAVVGYFRKDLIVYVREGLRLLWKREKPVNAEGRLAWLLVLSAVPAAIAGALFSNFIEDKLGTPFIIGLCMIFFGLLLYAADRRTGARHLHDYDTGDSLKIGTAQILALNPGTSRSGITITAARFLGFNRDAAARASFLMAIPVTAGAILFEAAKLVKEGVPDGFVPPMIVGIITSAVAGWVAVWGTIKLVRTHTFLPFVIYRVGVGVLVLLLVITGVR